MSRRRREPNPHVGKVVEVLFDDHRWYACTVREYDSIRERYTVQYSEGEPGDTEQVVKLDFEAMRFDSKREMRVPMAAGEHSLKRARTYPPPSLSFASPDTAEDECAIVDSSASPAASTSETSTSTSTTQEAASNCRWLHLATAAAHALQLHVASSPKDVERTDPVSKRARTMIVGGVSRTRWMLSEAALARGSGWASMSACYFEGKLMTTGWFDNNNMTLRARRFACFLHIH